MKKCKEIEENNRKEKTRDLFKKNVRYPGNISCKDGQRKGQKNGNDPTEAENGKKK